MLVESDSPTTFAYKMPQHNLEYASLKILGCTTSGLSSPSRFQF